MFTKFLMKITVSIVDRDSVTYLSNQATGQRKKKIPINNLVPHTHLRQL